MFFNKAIPQPDDNGNETADRRGVLQYAPTPCQINRLDSL